MSLEQRLAALEVELAQLRAREAIRECLFGYCRGIDRCDEAALRRAYWPDATDQHGPYQGSASGFIDWALPLLRQDARLVHMLGNISIRLQGEQAAVESYFQAFQVDRDDAGQARETLLCGRYVDRFERRGQGAASEWRVAARTVVYDWLHQAPGPTASEADRFGVRQPIGAARPGDAWYGLLGSMGIADG